MKKRLDAAAAENGRVRSRTAAAQLIKSGAVTVNGAAVTKPSFIIDDEADIIEINGDSDVLKYVSRGGFKLETAIREFGVSPKGCVCLDIGASTGGFTDCMLQSGAKRVYAVDVGTAQLDTSLKADSRVISLENTDIRTADEGMIPEKAQFITVDVSFISLKLILPVIPRFAAEGAYCAALIKPQFEYGRHRVKNGVIRSPAVHRAIVSDICDFAAQLGFKDIKTTESDIKGGDGNKEFLLGAFL